MLITRRKLITGAAALAGMAALPRDARAAATTWNPSDKAATIALSGGNLIATTSSTGGGTTFRSVRATNSKTTGKFFFEATINANGSTGWFVGLINATATLANFCGADTNGVGWQPGSNVTYYSGSLLTNTVDIVSVGQTGIVAADIGADLWWVYAPGAARWCGSGAASPITGVGGLALHGTGAIFPGWTGFSASTGDQGTGNFGASSFVNSTVTAALVVAGWAPWDGAAPPPGANKQFFRSFP